MTTSSTVRLGLVVLAAWAGCMRDPDASKLVCQTNDQCPAGYGCTTAHKCTAGQGPADASSGVSVDQHTADTSNLAMDGPTIDTSSNLGDTPIAPDNSEDATVSATDVAVDFNSGTGGSIERGDGSLADAASVDAADAPLPGNAGAGGAGGITATGGAVGSGGVISTGGVSAGGVTTTGGTAAAGTTVTGGIVGTGGTGTGGTTGSGGSSAACQENSTKCSGNGVQSCTNGQWAVAVACGPHQTCSGSIGSAKCTCQGDPVCNVSGSACANSALLATCSQDADGCLYQASSMACSNGACAGSPGSASCCTNQCTLGSTQCLSSTTIQACAMGSSGCTIKSTSNCSTSLVCERYGNASCLDPEWAEWPIPNTQADVTAGAPNLQSYTNNGDNTISDNVTQLMWQQTVPTATYTWANALAYCPTLSVGSHSDWRLPSLIELMSIVDFGVRSPSINSTYFPSTPTGFFWSSTPSVTTSAAWGIVFDAGGSGGLDVSTSSGRVRCVR
jgi:hypothetical protein